MNENLKSAIFVLAAVAVLLVAWVARPSVSKVDEWAEQRGKPIDPDFTDPLAATSLDVIEYDEATGEAKPFSVHWTNGRWTIPSHNDYPADAKEHMVDAASSVLRLTILDVVSREKKDHELYGVVDPGENLSAGAKGVGMRVTMADKSGNKLLALIIGKPAAEKKDKDFSAEAKEGEKKDLRYVRKVGEDPVYLVSVNPDKLTIKFGDWIEKDLLKLQSWDVKTVELLDYSFDPRRMHLDQRARIVLENNDSGDPKWKFLEDVAIQGDKALPQKLAADEEPNAKKLDDLKSALSELKIVDVAKKPAVLSGGLRTKGKLQLDQAAADSLASRGFYLVPMEDKGYDLISTEGEIHVGMKDGVQYVLRFGKIASAGTPKKDAKKDSAKKDEKKDDKSETAGLNRYLFVMSSFDPAAIEKPKLESLPPEPKPEAKPGAKTADAKPGTKPGEKKEEAKKDDKAAQAKVERERIEKENKSKQEDYDKKIADGKKKVEDLNARFADWYYVIDDSVYQKIHLGRKDVIQKKEKKEEAKKDDGHDHGAEKPKADSPAEFKDLMQGIPAAKPAAAKADAAKPGAPKSNTAKAENSGTKMPAAVKPAATKPSSPTEKKPDTAKPAEKKPVTPAPTK
jgi:hypothetical protein